LASSGASQDHQRPRTSTSDTIENHCLAREPGSTRDPHAVSRSHYDGQRQATEKTAAANPPLGPRRTLRRLRLTHGMVWQRATEIVSAISDIRPRRSRMPGRPAYCGQRPPEASSLQRDAGKPAPNRLRHNLVESKPRSPAVGGASHIWGQAVARIWLSDHGYQKTFSPDPCSSWQRSA